jgi:uncharacterized protein YqgV (UPF0045/DUF77 family)
MEVKMDTNQETVEGNVNILMNVIQEKMEATINTGQEEMTAEMKASEK